ncbi:MAG TPA: M48 family peptidase, partial [Cellvibrionaceae bacterium]|nr:M48 family peptidase [Cellvibrionaceae bacterium]
EVHGLAGHILDVHKARAEYFILHGIYDKAEIQLRNALKLVGNDFQGRARLEQRLIDVKNMQKEKLG